MPGEAVIMMGNVDFDITASYRFGQIGFLSSALYALYAEFAASPSSTDIPGFLLVVVSTLMATIVGGVLYGTLVGRIPRLSVPTQGAFSGALIIWISLTLMVPLVQVIIHINESILSPEFLSYLLWSLFISATFLTVFIGIFIIPIGALAGYALARKRTDNPAPIPILSRFKENG